jgi:hypothetical protein
MTDILVRLSREYLAKGEKKESCSWLAEQKSTVTASSPSGFSGTE